MTRKDYTLIANEIAASTVTANLTETQREDLALSFAKTLHQASPFNANGNKSFNAEKFVRASIGGDLLSEFCSRAVEAL